MEKPQNRVHRAPHIVIEASGRRGRSTPEKESRTVACAYLDCGVENNIEFVRIQGATGLWTKCGKCKREFFVEY